MSAAVDDNDRPDDDRRRRALLPTAGAGARGGGGGVDPAVARERKIERFRRERAGRERLKVCVWKGGVEYGFGCWMYMGLGWGDVRLLADRQINSLIGPGPSHPQELNALYAKLAREAKGDEDALAEKEEVEREVRASAFMCAGGGPMPFSNHTHTLNDRTKLPNPSLTPPTHYHTARPPLARGLHPPGPRRVAPAATGAPNPQHDARAGFALPLLGRTGGGKGPTGAAAGRRGCGCCWQAVGTCSIGWRI